MDWESYRTDIEAIKLAVNECERLGVDKEELLIISIYRLYEFYKTEDESIFWGHYCILRLILSWGWNMKRTVRFFR